MSGLIMCNIKDFDGDNPERSTWLSCLSLASPATKQLTARAVRLLQECVARDQLDLVRYSNYICTVGLGAVRRPRSATAGRVHATPPFVCIGRIRTLLGAQAPYIWLEVCCWGSLCVSWPLEVTSTERSTAGGTVRKFLCPLPDRIPASRAQKRKGMDPWTVCGKAPSELLSLYVQIACLDPQA